MDRKNPDGSTTRTAQEAQNEASRSAFLRRTQEEEAWKVAQLAATLASGVIACGRFEVYDPQGVVGDAAILLAEARHQVAAEHGGD